MGDVGSTFLGFVLATIAIWTFVEITPSRGLWILAASPFIVDASMTLLRRMAAGEPWWRPHRRHLYQRFVDRGARHAVVTSAYVLAALATGFAGVAFARLGSDPWIAIAVTLLASAAVHQVLLARFRVD